MSELKISVLKNTDAKSLNIAVAVVAEGEKLALGPSVSGLELSDVQLRRMGASAKPESVTRLVVGDRVYLLVGVGADIASPTVARNIGGALARAAKDLKQLDLDLPVTDVDQAEALLEGLAIGGYEFTRYKSNAKPSQLKAVRLISSLSLAKARLDRIGVIAAAVNTTRDLVNTPANDFYPQKAAELAKKQSVGSDVTVKVLDEKQLAAGGYGGLVGVGQGSVRPPRLVKLSYSPKKPLATLALVGKGITFDTGGLSLKPAASMVGMKYDMTGAATIMQAVFAIAALKLPIAVTGWMCMAENMPSGSATRPNDVIRARNGKTIEVMNTDAEGRLVLADGLSAASEEFPDLIVDVATLTGAASVALGKRYAGLMGHGFAIDAVKEAAASAGELVWHMPLAEELRELLESPIADIANAKIGNTAGGMLLGGHFLADFIGKGKDGQPIPWAHLDIAGPANNDGAAYGSVPKGSSGVMVRTLVALAEQLAAK